MASCFLSSGTADGGALLPPSKAADGGVLVRRAGLCTARTATRLQRVVAEAGRRGFCSDHDLFQHKMMSAGVVAAPGRGGFSAGKPKMMSAVVAAPGSGGFSDGKTKMNSSVVAAHGRGGFSSDFFDSIPKVNSTVIAAHGRGAFSSYLFEPKVTSAVAAHGRGAFSSYLFDPKVTFSVAGSALGGKAGMYASEDSGDVDDDGGKMADGTEVSADKGATGGKKAEGKEKSANGKIEGEAFQIPVDEDVAELVKMMLIKTLSMVDKMVPHEASSFSEPYVSEMKLLREDCSLLLQKVETNVVGFDLPRQVIELHTRICLAIELVDAPISMSPVQRSVGMPAFWSTTPLHYSMAQADRAFWKYKKIVEGKGGSVSGEEVNKEKGTPSNESTDD